MLLSYNIIDRPGPHSLRKRSCSAGFPGGIKNTYVFIHQISAFKPQVIIRAGSTVPAWYYQINNYTNQAGVWRHYEVPMNGAWTDQQAYAAGWQRDTGPAISFANTMRQVWKVGVRLKYPQQAAAYLGVDNFTVRRAPITLHKTPTLRMQRFKRQKQPMRRTR